MSQVARSWGLGVPSERYACPCGGSQPRGGKCAARPWSGVPQWVDQSGKWADHARGHARRLKPSSLADEDRRWCHARQQEPAPLAWEDRKW